MRIHMFMYIRAYMQQARMHICRDPDMHTHMQACNHPNTLPCCLVP